MSENAVYQKESDARALIRKNFGCEWDENYLLGKFFNPLGQGFILLVSPGTLRPHTQSEALWMIEHWLGFPHPHPRYLEEYFIYKNGSYVPRVSFEKLRRKIHERNLVQQLGAVMHLDYHSCPRQAVLVEITSVVRSFWVDAVH